MKKIKCPKCGHDGIPIQKMWCLICEKCRFVVGFINSEGAVEERKIIVREWKK
jgi:hypothetical protein